MKLLRSIAWTTLFSGITLCLGEELDPRRLAEDISRRVINDAAEQFNVIAKNNDGNRAFGTPGYRESADYVLGVLQQCGSAMNVSVLPFTHPFTNTTFSLTGPDGEAVPVLARLNNRDQPLPSHVSAPLVGVRGFGCVQEQWSGVDASRKIALIQRGGCFISEKINLAHRNGAVAVVIYNQTPADSAPAAGSDDVGERIPSGFITLAVSSEVGRGRSRRLSNRQDVRVTIGLTQTTDPKRTSWNIVAESAVGDPDSVVMLGAHVDSVGSGPGINDDGSGSAGLLAVASALCQYGGFRNKVRFAWWGAEELGLVGSNYYASQLSEAEADKIRFYFNYDMIGSPQPNWTVYADNEADMFGARHLYSTLTTLDASVSYRKFNSNSDYAAFRKLGIPGSGIFTGAGDPADACYHQACDDASNININATLVATKAAAYAMAKLALSLEGLPARGKMLH